MKTGQSENVLFACRIGQFDKTSQSSRTRPNVCFHGTLYASSHVSFCLPDILMVFEGRVANSQTSCPPNDFDSNIVEAFIVQKLRECITSRNPVLVTLLLNHDQESRLKIGFVRGSRNLLDFPAAYQVDSEPLASGFQCFEYEMNHGCPLPNEWLVTGYCS